MEAFKALEAVLLPLAQANVDTDQIVPACYLQKPRTAPFGDFLFQMVIGLTECSGTFLDLRFQIFIKIFQFRLRLAQTLRCDSKKRNQ